MESWHLTKTFEEHRWITSVCIDPSEKFIAIVPADSQVYISDLQSGKKLDFFDFQHGVTSICFNRSGTKFATLSHKPETCIFKVTKNENRLTHEKIDSFAHQGEIISTYFDDNENLLGIESDDDIHQIHIKNLKTNEKIISFEHNSWVIVTALSPSKKLLATGSGNKKARLFNIQKKIAKEITSFNLDDSVTAFDFDSLEQLLAVASRDNKVHIFNLVTYNKIASLNHDKFIFSICFAPSGNIATGSIDNKIRIFTKTSTSENIDAQQK